MAYPRKTLLIRLSKIAHNTVNPIAWKLYPKGDHKNNWLWRFNNWVATPHTDWYVYKTSGKTRKQWEDEVKNG